MSNGAMTIRVSPSKCVAPVGNPPRVEVIDMDVLVDAVSDLAKRFRGEGLEGSDLDTAIVAALPQYLEALLCGGNGQLH